MGIDYSSKLSAWLANGSISSRQIYWEIIDYEKEVKKNQSTYWLIFELIWRDYFKYIALKHQDAIFHLGGILNKDYHWDTADAKVNSWIEGTTREPFVNANMIELNKTGWMSNRGRQNVASYFAKDLLLDWRIGAAYFESQLIDYDVHSNYGNWMYVAGVGNDLEIENSMCVFKQNATTREVNFNVFGIKTPCFNELKLILGDQLNLQHSWFKRSRQ